MDFERLSAEFFDDPANANSPFEVPRYGDILKSGGDPYVNVQRFPKMMYVYYLSSIFDKVVDSLTTAASLDLVHFLNSPRYGKTALEFLKGCCDGSYHREKQLYWRSPRVASFGKFCALRSKDSSTARLLRSFEYLARCPREIREGFLETSDLFEYSTRLSSLSRPASVASFCSSLFFSDIMATTGISTEERNACLFFACRFPLIYCGVVCEPHESREDVLARFEHRGPDFVLNGAKSLFTRSLLNHQSVSMDELFLQMLPVAGVPSSSRSYLLLPVLDVSPFHSVDAIFSDSPGGSLGRSFFDEGGLGSLTPEVIYGLISSTSKFSVIPKHLASAVFPACMKDSFFHVHVGESGSFLIPRPLAVYLPERYCRIFGGSAVVSCDLATFRSAHGGLHSRCGSVGDAGSLFPDSTAKDREVFLRGYTRYYYSTKSLGELESSGLVESYVRRSKTALSRASLALRLKSRRSSGYLVYRPRLVVSMGREGCCASYEEKPKDPSILRDCLFPFSERRMPYFRGYGSFWEFLGPLLERYVMSRRVQ